MPKWITRIELIDDVYLGCWESLPSGREVKWSDDALATVNSRIAAPLSVWDDFKDTASGAIRFEFDEVSTDDGGSWSQALFTTRSEPNVWVTWAFTWNLPTRGTYRILAWATDSAGQRQSRTYEGDDRYDGRTGWHRVPVDVATG